MLNRETDKSLVCKTAQAKNAFLFTNSLAKIEVMGTTSVQNSALRRNGRGTQ